MAKIRVAKRGMAWLASQVGVNRQRINELVLEGRIPRKKDYTHADAKAAIAMLAEGRATNNATMSQADEPDQISALGLTSEKEARVRLIIARRVGQELQNKQTEGRLVDREEVERGRIERILAVKEAMFALVHTLPPKLVGLGAAAMEPVLEAEFRGVCNRFAGK